MFSTILVAVPALRRGEPAITSGPTSEIFTREWLDQARRLLSSLAAMSLQVRDLMPELVRSETTAQFARQWFERYVAQFFIRDYADLHRADHPLARRAQILLMVQEIEAGPLREDIAGWYRELGFTDTIAPKRGEPPKYVVFWIMDSLRADRVTAFARRDLGFDAEDEEVLSRGIAGG